MGRRFVAERRRDPYYRAAQAQELRSRAAFKLADLSSRFPVFHEGDRVLDLGAAPGGWALIARDLLGGSGTIVAVDPRPIEPADGIEIIRMRVEDPRLRDRLGPARFDVVLSDMSPRISGAYATDHARSVDLVRAAFVLATAVLHEGGSFVAKVFQGDLLDGLTLEMRPAFRSLRRTKPAASRERSSEVYFVGLGFRPPGTEPP